MNFFEQFNLPAGEAICYSGFREGQQPGGHYPSYEEVKEDLLLLQQRWKYLRLYDCDAHAETVLNVIEKEALDFKVMLGAYITAEVNNPACPWGGGIYSGEQLQQNKKLNEERIQQLIRCAHAYPEIIFSVSVGNEACVDWTDHLVPAGRVMDFARQVKAAVHQPVTYCENYVPWLNKLQPLAEILDFISIHTYPVWEYKSIGEGMDYTIENFNAVAAAYPGKPVVITEAGWATNSNGRGIEPRHANEINQAIYCEQLTRWSTESNILSFVFEAFDENWKGSPHPLEPEKHWGLFTVERKPKQVLAGR